MISEDTLLEALRAHAGIDAAQTGEAALRQEIRRALAACPHPDRLLDINRPEWHALLEASLVPETWFFRNMEAFAAFTHWVTENWLPTHPCERLRVLSLPCATGEEPYALAMCLLEAGLSRDSFQIRAGDISQISLARARAARYRRNSFRTGFDEKRFGKYFDDLGEGERQVSATIRELVEFEWMNLVKPTEQLSSYHVIFCRNALIYFNPETQHQVVRWLRTILSDDGLLFLGPVEPPIAIQCGFATAKLPMAFACVKLAGAPQAARESTHATPPAHVRHRLSATPKPGIPKLRRELPVREAPSTPAMAVVSSLATARALADAGEEMAAAEMLDQLAAAEEPSPEWFCLRGIISEALGQGPAAETYYRKALYLDPAHYETLTHLALLLELDGRGSAAAQLRRRANQLTAR